MKSGGEAADAQQPAAPQQQVTAQQRSADANTVDVEAKTKS